MRKLRLHCVLVFDPSDSARGLLLCLASHKRYQCQNNLCRARKLCRICSSYDKYVTLEHESSLESLGMCSNSQKYIVWVKIIIFLLMPKIIRILISCSMKIFPTVNISNSILISSMHC